MSSTDYKTLIWDFDVMQQFGLKWLLMTLISLAEAIFVSENVIYEPPCGKTNNVVSERVWHKRGCIATEAGQKLEILELSRGGIVLSE